MTTRKPAEVSASRRREAKSKPPLTVSRAALLADGSDALFRSFLHNLLAFSSRVETIRYAFGKLVGLSGVRYSVLISIFHLEGEEGVAVGDVAAHLHLGLATLTVETNTLAEQELIVKQNDPRDRRRVLLRLTPRGVSLIEDLAPVQRQVNDELFRALSKVDFERVSDLLERLIPCGDRAVSVVREIADEKS